MAEINNALALAVKPMEVDLTTPLLTATRLKQADTQNALAQVQLQDAGERRNALAAYKSSGNADDLRGQPDLMAQVVQIRGQLDDQKRKTYDDALLRNAKGAQRVAGISDPTERAAAWKDELDTALRERRIDEPTYRRLAATPPNDLVLSNVIKAGLTLEQAINLEQKDKDRKAGNAAIAAIAPILGGTAPAAGTDAATPRGIRNNNPLNIEAGKFSESLPGYAGTDRRFARFENPEHGLAAADKLLENYGTKQGINTVQGVINRWAPATENNTSAYADFVAKKLGVKPGDKIDLADPATRGKLIGAMGEFENGQPLPTSVAGSGERLAAALPQLEVLRMLPGLPESVSKGLDGIIQHARKLSEPTGDIKEYQLYARQERASGRAPVPFKDWQIEMKGAGRTQINVQQNTGSKETQKGLSERYLKAEDAAIAAGGEIRLYQTIDKLLDDPNVYTGTGGDVVAQLKKAGATLFGLDLKGVPNAEVARKITDEIAASFKAASRDQNTSNYERQIYERMATGLNDSAQGRKLLVQFRVADLEHRQQQAEVWRKYLKEDGSVDPQVFSALAELEAKRREGFGSFVEKANDIAGTAKQAPPTAGVDPAKVKEELRQQYGITVPGGK